METDNYHKTNVFVDDFCSYAAQHDTVLVHYPAPLLAHTPNNRLALRPSIQPRVGMYPRYFGVVIHADQAEPHETWAAWYLAVFNSTVSACYLAG